MNKFEELCEGFGIIKQTKRIMYPKQISFSEEFKQALKNEYYRLTLEEDAEHPIKNRPEKFLKALQFHVVDLERNKESELEALRNMMGEEKKPIIKSDKDIFGSPALGKSELAAKEENRKKIFKPLNKKAIRKTEESTEPYQATVKGEKKEDCNCKAGKKENQRRKEVEKENMNLKESTDLEFVYESMLNENYTLRTDPITIKKILQIAGPEKMVEGGDDSHMEVVALALGQDPMQWDTYPEDIPEELWAQVDALLNKLGIEVA